MDVVSVRCTRSEFQQSATRLSKETAWELRSRRDAFGGAIDWLQATYALPTAGTADESPVLATVCVLFHPDFRVPQLGFVASSLLSLEDVRRAVPNLSFTNTTPEVSGAAGAVSASPLVSCSWSDDVQQHMWLVHPCDTENLLRCCRYDGLQGNVLSVFLHAMAAYFPFAPALLPPA